MDKKSKDLKRVYEIRIWGTVQGVGFRPFVHRLANNYNLSGFVSNDGSSVRIVINAEEKQLEEFLQDIKNFKPQSSEIVRIDVKEKACGYVASRSSRVNDSKTEEGKFHEIDDCKVHVSNEVESHGNQDFESFGQSERSKSEEIRCHEAYDFSGFEIRPSSENSDTQVFISPDLAVCDNCLKDLYEESNRRYLHPFISCMECGPRYSIIDRVPYDRENTTMSDFPMCSSCSGEYRSLEDRRYHAQTISCYKCGPQLKFREIGNSEEILELKALSLAVEILKQGGILAVKGIGGFHLCCSPFEENAVERLRELKGREEKPFAVMFNEVAQVDKYCVVNEEEKKQLISRERPIVLLERKESDISVSVFKSSRFLGCFLAYTPLHKLLIDLSGPLVMTSANLSGEPIIIDNEKILTLDGNKLSGVLYNDRRILTGIDDSVVKVSPVNGIQFIRRARGYVPLPIYVGNKATSEKQILACGSDLKNTFCLTQNGYAYLSQYGGDLEDVGNFNSYKANVDRLKKLLRISPEKVCCDLHPGYQSSKFAREYGVEVLEVQHHYAHILSVIAENSLCSQVIGVALDGTGYGVDGNMWGGEFLLASPYSFSRAGHLKYVPMLGGDSSVKEAWKTGYSYLYSAGLETYIEDERWPVIKAALENNINKVLSSSMGRLFDAISSITGIKDYSGFEGECAIMLENYAYDFLKSHKLQSIFSENGGIQLNNWWKPYNYDIIEMDGTLIGDMNRCIREIVMDSLNGVDKSDISWRFHVTVIDYILKMCTRIRELYKINEVALSGGVFQNSIIFEGAVNTLKHNGFNVFFNKKVPVNDGGISLGQAYAGMYENS
jgi:hydrogenase maturation protein HypF